MSESKSCPSAPFKKGNSVFAIFEGDQMTFTDSMIPITEALMSESSFFSEKTEVRTTMKCVTKGCINWNGKKCTVPDQMSYFFQPLEEISAFKNCPLKTTCRWYAQDGEQSCSICPLIRTKPFGK